MKKLSMCLMLVLAVACSKSKESPTTTGSNAAAGSGSAPVAGGSGSAAMAGSGSAAMAGSGSDAGSAAMAGSGSAMTAGSGSGSAVAMAGSADGSAAGWDWDKLTHQEQMDYMKKEVVPTMKPLFQKFDAKHYANFGCKTCHGKDPQKSKYKMPSADLPKLDFAALQAGKQKPEIAKWMGQVVKPEMAKLLKMPEMDEKMAPGSFGCLDCHQQKK